MRIALGADHGGVQLKDAIVSHLGARSGVVISDLGTCDESVDYPDFADKVATAILDGTADLGILVCGTGIGISIRANRYDGIRAALVHNEFTAEMTKAHNNANVLCLGGRVVPTELALKLVDIWLDTPFEGGRHQKRIDKLG
ncbi:MAG: ribose 5-phosphate isomerase B [bacterium]|nr:ribose 5-phosphate isomerase B [bacterium]